ncbi:hypothetical protein A8H39_00440 [Paraburkholderia fungorum]|uniref:ProQ/FinO family protein n=1 Tax=Paraburkholderia fungorum TaxID=134537 RepID=UPI0004816B95|nr:ProQ/FinO family protein [Paraburkholderia fungorum]PNE59652.1 hypothetical protein A8H39_00440 [Paraburkholderia fungorum]
MASKKRIQRYMLAIEGLATRYPNAFSADPARVRPLKAGIVDDILADLRTPGVTRDVAQAVAFYQCTFAYLKAVAFVLRRRDLSGNRVELVTESDRLAAKAELKRRGRWTPAMRAQFKQRDWFDD